MVGLASSARLLRRGVEQMNLNDPSRRSFLDLAASHAGRCGGGFALGRQRRQCARGGRTAAPAGPHVPGPHFPGKAKHVIYLHMVGGPSQMDLYDYKPKMDDWYDKDLPDSVRKGQRLTTMTSGPGAVSHRAVEIQVRPARPERHVGQRAAALHGQDGRRHVLHPQHEHRGHQPRAGHHLHADRQSDHRPALPGLLGFVRAGLAQPEPADVRGAWWPSRPTRSSFRPFRPGSGRAAICRASTPACRSAPAAIRSCTSTIRPACRPTSAARRSTASARSTR